MWLVSSDFSNLLAGASCLNKTSTRSCRRANTQSSHGPSQLRSCTRGGRQACKMAGLDPNDPNEPFDTPRTPRMVLKDKDLEEDLSPDTEENVHDQTDGIFRNFVFQMYNIDRDEQDADDAPTIPEITAFTAESAA